MRKSLFKIAMSDPLYGLPSKSSRGSSRRELGLPAPRGFTSARNTALPNGGAMPPGPSGSSSTALGESPIRTMAILCLRRDIAPGT